MGNVILCLIKMILWNCVLQARNILDFVSFDGIVDFKKSEVCSQK